jgi:transcriptional regulator with PAS, ATPase and Fis domain
MNHLVLTNDEVTRILSSTVDGVFILDRSRRFIYMNQACEALTGRKADDVIGFQCKCHDLMNCQDDYGRSLAGALCPGDAVFKNLLTSAKQRMQIRSKDGRSRWIETVYTPIRDSDGRIELVLGITRDVSDAKEKEDELLDTTKNLREEVDRLRNDMRKRYGFASIVSKSPNMQGVFEKVKAACTNSSSVLISGESGTGKEVVARTIHYQGLQKDGPFVPLNCAALSKDLIESELFGHVRGAFTGANNDFEGLFRAAEGGTIFLDEIADMPSETQAKLLRAIQDKRVRPVGSTSEVPINARIITATNRNVADAVRDGRLRQDLFYRLSVITIDLPPLRHRKSDIPLLAEHFIEQFNRQSLRRVTGLAPDAWAMLVQHDWPGNIRELQNAIESSFAIGTGDLLRSEDLPANVRGETIRIDDETGGQAPADTRLLDSRLEGLARDTIINALKNTKGQRTKAARHLGISRSRLYRRMEALGIDPNDVSA